MKEKAKGIVIGVLATAAVASVVNVAAEEIYKELKKKKRIVFKYIHCYI